MNFASEDEAHAAVQKSGLDFIGRIKTLAKPSISLPLSPLQHALIQSPIDFADTKTDEEKNHILLSKKRDVQKELLDYLAEMDLTKEQREDLSLRIKKKLFFYGANSSGLSAICKNRSKGYGFSWEDSNRRASNFLRTST